MAGTRGDAKGPLSQVELDRQEVIKKFRNEVAEKLGIDPTLIATRSHVAQLARDPMDLGGLLPWQREMLEPKLANVDGENGETPEPE